MAAAGVGDDGQQRVALRSTSARAGGEVDVALRADRVLRAVALGVVVGVVEQGVDGLVALQVDDRAASAPAGTTSGPRRPRRDDLVVRSAGAQVDGVVLRRRDVVFGVQEGPLALGRRRCDRVVGAVGSPRQAVTRSGVTV